MDTKFFDLNDLVRADCHDCVGCSSCCRNMGESILLDPYDVFQLQKAGKEMQTLLQSGAVALSVQKGMILPYLQMNEATGACCFLNSEGRCDIHDSRPGICRLFPLGRNYEDGKMNYFLLEHACSHDSRSKIKVSKWLGVEPARTYHRFVLDWHDFRREMSNILAEATQEQAKELNMHFLRTFYLSPYDTYDTAVDFYSQYAARAARLL